MKWVYSGFEVPNHAPSNYGFVYLITYSDRRMYIGKKKFYQTKTMKPLKSGVNRVGGKFFNKIVNRKVTKFESVTTENDWRTYVGSSKNSKTLKVVKKEILQLYNDSINLTFGEIEWLVKSDVLRSDMYLNDNIAGKFFRGKIK